MGKGRKALIVGIDYYTDLAQLSGCVDDAHAVKQVLDRHADGTKNFQTKLLTGTGPNDVVSRKMLKEEIRELFAGDEEIALLYFAGHGHAEATGGYLCGTDTTDGDDGLPLGEVLKLANDSTVTNKILLLDSCYSGVAGTAANDARFAELSQGLTILTASSAKQYAHETDEGGVFTNLLVDALNGAAGNLLGEITPGSVYAHIDQSLGSWDRQRPLFRTNVNSFVSLRQVHPPISIDDLKAIATLFPSGDHEFPLDPTFEPDRPIDGVVVDPVEENTRRFAILQKLNRVNLVVPVGATHMYHAAIESRGCKLTVLGEHYRRLVVKEHI
ncbi:caspase family protein [Sphingomonas sp. UV9]|uniref:caspase family protein n=1 Tax=Sphingomonas sp. UV9 TaxID=1851410 RepID=UPI000FFC9B4C|nr:caspase family protein [Sphingomonas sp. UV9]RXD04886.1 caspase family protein [Sphingomonas sp. UV9]